MLNTNQLYPLTPIYLGVSGLVLPPAGEGLWWGGGHGETGMGSVGEECQGIGIGMGMGIGRGIGIEKSACAGA